MVAELRGTADCSGDNTKRRQSTVPSGLFEVLIICVSVCLCVGTYICEHRYLWDPEDSVRVPADDVTGEHMPPGVGAGT